MKFKLIYFDDQFENIDCYQIALEDDFCIVGVTDHFKYEEVLKENRPHGILIDVNMPIIDGFTLYEKILLSADYNNCPVFFISSDIDNCNRLRALKSGAIDFLSRLMPIDEVRPRLKNRIKLFLQRAMILEIGNLRLDSHSFLVTVSSHQVDLTINEMRILSCLMRAIPDPLCKSELLETVWGQGHDQNVGKVHVHLSNLKNKLSQWDHEIKFKEGYISITPSFP